MDDPTTMTKSSRPDWDAVRADYEAGTLPLTAIAAIHGTSVRQIGKKRRMQSWRMRRPTTGKPQRHNMLARMMGLIEAQITQMEQAMHTRGSMDASEMRLLESMTKALDKIIALDNAERKTAPKSARADPELEAIRQRLTRRIEKLETER